MKKTCMISMWPGETTTADKAYYTKQKISQLQHDKLLLLRILAELHLRHTDFHVLGSSELKIVQAAV